MSQPESQGLQKTLVDMSGVLAQIAQQMQEDKQDAHETKMAVVSVRNELNDFKQDVTNEIGGMKDSRYLEPYEAAKVQEAAKSRVADILREWCRNNGEDEDIIFSRYFGKFVRAVHHDAKRVGLEIGKIIYTPKRNYEMLLEFIGKWYPTRGVEGQMRHYDKCAEANKTR